MKTCYYYQTFVGLKDVLQNSQNVDQIIVSSLHFDDGKQDIEIFLNDYSPDDKRFDELWEETQKCFYNNVKILVMMGGAGLAFHVFFSDFSKTYKLLLNFLKEKPWITGIDLDVEEYVEINNIKKLINCLKNDMGEDFIITMAPLGSSLANDGSGMGGFDYKQLYKSEEGKKIKYFHAQCYNGSFNENMYKNIVKNGYPPDKIIMGMMSGDYGKSNFNDALSEVEKILKLYPNMAGVFDWEYLDAPPDKTNPTIWAQSFKNLKIVENKSLVLSHRSNWLSYWWSYWLT